MAKYQIQFGASEAVCMLSAVESRYLKCVNEFMTLSSEFPQTREYLLELMDEYLRLWWRIENAEIV